MKKESQTQTLIPPTLHIARWEGNRCSPSYAEGIIIIIIIIWRILNPVSASETIHPTPCTNGSCAFLSRASRNRRNSGIFLPIQGPEGEVEVEHDQARERPEETQDLQRRPSRFFRRFSFPLPTRQAVWGWASISSFWDGPRGCAIAEWWATRRLTRGWISLMGPRILKSPFAKAPWNFSLMGLQGFFVGMWAGCKHGPWSHRWFMWPLGSRQPGPGVVWCQIIFGIHETIVVNKSILSLRKIATRIIFFWFLI